jgi:hypothetical protein
MSTTRRGNARVLPGSPEDDVIVISNGEPAPRQRKREADEVIEIQDDATGTGSSSFRSSKGRDRLHEQAASRGELCSDEVYARELQAAMADEDAARHAQQLQMEEYAQPWKRPKTHDDAALARQLQDAENAGAARPPLHNRGPPRQDRAARERVAAVDRQLDLGIVLPRLHLRGDAPLLLNRLPGYRQERKNGAVGVVLPVEVCNEDLYWHQPFLRSALLASYGVQYDLVERMIRRSPAAARRGGVIVCDNYDHDTQDSGFVEGETHTVVMPPFFDRNANTSKRARFERGTMHPKMQLLEFDGGTPDTQFLRVVIGSANLGDYDRSINNQFWSHDFPLQQEKKERKRKYSNDNTQMRKCNCLISSLPPSPLLNIHYTWAPAVRSCGTERGARGRVQQQDRGWLQEGPGRLHQRTAAPPCQCACSTAVGISAPCTVAGAA